MLLSMMLSRIMLLEFMLVSRVVRLFIRFVMGVLIMKMNRLVMNSDVVIGVIMIGIRGWINLW